MKIELSPGSSADPERFAALRETYRLLGDELERVRASAVAWRNGLGALLGGLVGFSLIKGRTEVDDLARPWAAAVGVLLAAAIAAGTFGGMRLLRAAHGRPRMTPVAEVTGGLARDHAAAHAAVRDLALGIRGALACMVLLVAAVGLTWYGPAKDGPVLRVTVPGATVCGQVVSTSGGKTVLDGATGMVTVDLTQAMAIQAVESC